VGDLDEVGRLMSPRACCAGGCRVVSSWCDRGRGARTRFHAVLMRRLKGRCPFSDMFGKAGRPWLRGLELPVEECETVEATMRQIEFLDAEIAEVDRLVRSAGASIWRRASSDERAGGQRGVRGDVPGCDRPTIRRFKTSRQAGRLPGAGSEGPPVRVRARSSRPHLKAGVATDTLGAGRGDAQRRATARASARVHQRIRAPPRL